MHDTVQLRKCCQKDKDISQFFLNVFPADLLPSRLPDNCYLILNTDPSNKGGQHWVAVCKKEGRGFYFDSYGRTPSRWFHAWQPLDRFRRSEADIQQDNSDVCGDYCLAFLKHMATGRSFETFHKNFDENDDLSNDKAARAFAHKRWPRILNPTPHVVEGAYDTDNQKQKPSQVGGLAETDFSFQTPHLMYVPEHSPS